jgi:acetyl-CoA synthetase
MTDAQSLLDARAFLLSHRERYDEAYRSFRWPVLVRFNWALDWFDRHADGKARLALWLLHDEAPE